jgi:hypothetical protein
MEEREIDEVRTMDVVAMYIIEGQNLASEGVVTLRTWLARRHTKCEDKRTDASTFPTTSADHSLE